MFQPKGDNHYHPGEISDMAVFSPYKGKGIGRAMIQHAIEQSGAPVYHSEQLTDEGKPFSTGTPEFAAPPGLKQQFRDYYNNTNEPLENFQYKPPVTAFFVRKSDAPAWNQWLGDNHPTQQLFPQVPIEQVAALRGHGQFKSDAEVNALATDIKQNGMTNPISMSMRRGWTKDSTGKRYFSETPTPFFEDGHHRLQAAGRAGLTHVPVMMFNGETTEGNQAAMDYDDKAYADSRKFFDSHQDLVKQEQDKINNRPTGPQSPWPPPPLNKNAWFVRKANAWTQNGRVQTLSHPSGLSGTVGPSMIPGAGFMGAINHPTAGTVHIKNYPTEDEAKSAVTGQLDSGQFANAQKVAPPAMTPRPISAPTKQSVPLYHGTTQENLTQVLPATQHGGNVVFPHETDHSYAYATPNLDDAWEYAEKAWHATSEGIPRVYQVSSINGDEEPDPQQRADQSFRGNNENDLRSSTGFDVHHEMPMPEHMGTPEEWGDTGSDFRTSATQMMNPADLWSHTRDLSLPHQQSKVNDLAQSIQQNGYQADWADRPIHVSWDNPEGTPDISDGNHRLRAMEQAGYNQPIPVHTAFFVRVAGPRINPYTDELEDENPQPGAFQADRSITGPGHPLRM
ncbi:MAG TPA: GNAT family N-acetyltransferase, partial [Ktedonobacteraceae bacterium]|nr:GNAT family N-acetyltransferase [Ktedonobacteraceae bacterium]